MREKIKNYFKELSHKPAKIVVSIISAICVFLCFFITIEVINANRENRPPSVFGVSVSYVPTESMNPTICAGDYVVYVKVDYDSIKKGDIIVYNKTDENKFIIHRVVEVCDGYLVTQGDNKATNPNPDTYVSDGTTYHVTPDLVFGKYTTTLSFLGFMSGGVNRNAIFLILIVLAFLMVITQVVSILVKAKKEAIEEEIKAKKKKQQEEMLAEMRKQIIEEELAKLKAQNNDKTQD